MRESKKWKNAAGSYYTYSVDNGEERLVAHANRKDALLFAREEAMDGYGCAVLRVVETVLPRRKGLPRQPEGLRPSDLPAGAMTALDPQ